MDNLEKSKIIARHIFEVGDEPNLPTTRIQFRSRINPDKEADNGGLCEKSLATCIQDILTAIDESSGDL